MWRIMRKFVQHFVAIFIACLVIKLVLVSANESSLSTTATATTTTTTTTTASNNEQRFLFRFFAHLNLDNDTISRECASSLRPLLSHSQELEEWAFKVIDANSVLEPGLSDGNIQFLGSFDQCLEQRIPPNVFNGTQSALAQYCTVSFPISMVLSEQESRAYPKFILEMLPPQAGICLPSLCSPDRDIAAIFANFARTTNQSLQLANCVTEKDVELKNRFHTRHLIILVIYTAIIVLGVADWTLPESSHALRRAIGCFSFSKNFLFLFQRALKRSSSGSTIPFARKSAPIAVTSVSPVDNGSHSVSSSASFDGTSSFTSSESSIQQLHQQSQAASTRFNPVAEFRTTSGTGAPRKAREITCLHGIRFISFFFILIYHTFTGAQTPSMNLLVLMQAELNFVKQLITNAALWVDTFLLMGGFVTCHTTLSRSDKFNTVTDHFLGHPKRLFHRYIRLTPSVAGMISLSILIEALGTGPLWFTYNFISESTCHKNWWLPLVYLNNIVNLNQLGSAPSECLAYLWYLSVDMQFFLVSPILIAFLANRSRKLQHLGVALNLGAITASSIWSAYLISTHSLTPTVLVTVYDLSYINIVYKSPFCRIGPYCVGILTAYFIHRFVFQRNGHTHNDADDEGTEGNSRLYGMALFVGGLSLIFTVNLLTYPWLQNGSYMNFYSVLYGATHRTVWAFGWALIVYVCTTGLLPALNRFLSCSLFQFLSKLTYQNYLVHDIIISAIIYSVRQKVYFSDFNLISATLQYLFITTIVSIGTFLMFEKPFINLQATFLR